MVKAAYESRLMRGKCKTSRSCRHSPFGVPQAPSNKLSFANRQRSGGGDGPLKPKCHSKQTTAWHKCTPLAEALLYTRGKYTERHFKIISINPETSGWLASFLEQKYSPVNMSGLVWFISFLGQVKILTCLVVVGVTLLKLVHDISSGKVCIYIYIYIYIYICVMMTTYEYITHSLTRLAFLFSSHLKK